LAEKELITLQVLQLYLQKLFSPTSIRVWYSNPTTFKFETIWSSAVLLEPRCATYSTT
jgi:hypothetical protein